MATQEEARDEFEAMLARSYMQQVSCAQCGVDILVDEAFAPGVLWCRGCHEEVVVQASRLHGD